MFMQRRENLIHLVATTIFVTSGIAFGLVNLVGDGNADIGLTAREILLASEIDLAPLAGRPLPLMFLSPENLVMWSLLAALWLALGLDASGQWLDPSDPPQVATRRTGTAAMPAWPTLSAALLLASCWPWLLGPLPWAAVLGALAAAALAFLATLRAEGQRRPAIGFLAGWSLGLAMALLAARLGSAFGLSLAQTAILAILPAACLGMVGQLLIGRMIGFSAALIWSFCGLAITTMGFSPMTSIAAILGIAMMAAVLIRAAS